MQQELLQLSHLVGYSERKVILGSMLLTQVTHCLLTQPRPVQELKCLYRTSSLPTMAWDLSPIYHVSRAKRGGISKPEARWLLEDGLV